MVASLEDIVGPQTKECGQPLKTKRDKLFFIECQKWCTLNFRGPGDIIFLHFLLSSADLLFSSASQRWG